MQGIHRECLSWFENFDVIEVVTMMVILTVDNIGGGDDGDNDGDDSGDNDGDTHS